MLDHKANISNLRKLKSYYTFFSDHSVMRLKIKEKEYNTHECVETKHYAAEQPMDHQRNQRGN